MTAESWCCSSPLLQSRTRATIFIIDPSHFLPTHDHCPMHLHSNFEYPTKRTLPWPRVQEARSRIYNLCSESRLCKHSLPYNTSAMCSSRLQPRISAQQITGCLEDNKILRRAALSGAALHARRGEVRDWIESRVMCSPIFSDLFDLLLNKTLTTLPTTTYEQSNPLSKVLRWVILRRWFGVSRRLLFM